MKDAISNDEVEEAVYPTKEEVLDDSAGNVDYPTVDDKLDAELEVTPSEDVSNNQW